MTTEELLLSNQITIMRSLLHTKDTADLHWQIEATATRLREIDTAARKAAAPRYGNRGETHGAPCDECDSATGHICPRHQR